MDGNRAMRVFVAFMITAAVLYGFYKYATAPSVYDGDRKEERICRLCRGMVPRCGVCGGKGKVKVIIPGTNHPLSVYFEVYDKQFRVQGMMRYSSVPGNGSVRSSGPGAINGAEIVLTDSSGKQVAKLTTGMTGQQAIDLRPGSYKLAVKKPGYRDYECDLSVPVRTDPIWLEKKKLPPEYYNSSEAGGREPVIGDDIYISVAMTGI